ncbi:hypothetical protein B7494_g5489 [Chlorociboria aeruginascens]|nr:hypothetical protein B7494_g5489 [Chlorociboria aeruginascens]
MSSRRESEVAHLEQLLREANQRADEERRARQEAEKKTSRTTFEEYIRTCHTLLSKPIRIQTNKMLGTQGSTTNRQNKPCPLHLKPWSDFPILQQELYEKVEQYIPRDAQFFNSFQYLTELGEALSDRPLASEKDLEQYQSFAVDRPTTNIISHLVQIEEARREFNLGDGIIFENHANTLSDNDEEVRQSLENLRLSKKAQSSSLNPKPKYSDQICVFKETDGTQRACLVVEYKPAHKLSILNLRAGLQRADDGDLDISVDILNRITIPTEPTEKFRYNSERLVVAALAQTYSYMLENGLEYSYLATGEAFVFLWIQEAEPHTLYYHLAEPNIEAGAHDGIDILLCRTAVSQALTCCLLALDSTPRNQVWRSQSLETSLTVKMDYDIILRQIPVEEKAMTPESSPFKARIHPFDRSPIMLRSRKPRKSRSSCGSTDIKIHEDPPSPSDSSDESSDVETPTKPKNRTVQSGPRESQAAEKSQSAKESNVRQRQYCTQSCLLSLVRKCPLDATCPNVSAHRMYPNSNRHALEQKTLAQHIRSQLAENPDDGCEPLGKQGARGALFKLTLHSHGYTFVAKGTVLAFIQDLEHEAQVYHHLTNVQGELIPIYLGNISLVRPYFLDIGVRIVHMLLMSWGGEQAEVDLMSKMSLDIMVETNRAVTKLRQCGVEHGDVRLPNVLWNPEIRNVILIDFERSEILKQRSILQETSPNQKRKYSQFGFDAHESLPLRKTSRVEDQGLSHPQYETSSWFIATTHRKLFKHSPQQPNNSTQVSIYLGNKQKGETPTYFNDKYNSRPTTDPNFAKNASVKMPQNEYAAPPGPPPSHQSQSYEPPSGPPPSRNFYNTPLGPPPNHKFSAPTGPPPGREEYAPPPGPPPTQVPYHDWQTAVPDTSLLPPPPSLGNQRSSTNNATEQQAEQGEAWCNQHPMAAPVQFPHDALMAIYRGEIGVIKPRVYNGDLTRPRQGIWAGRTKASSPDSCISSAIPLYSVFAHSPLRNRTSKTIYYEVKVSPKNRREVSLALGFSAPPYPTFRLPGWHRGSLAVHGDDGSKYVNDKWGGKDFTKPFKPGDTLGIGMIFTARDLNAPPAYNDGPARTTVNSPIDVEIIFTRNGRKDGEWNLHEEGDAKEDLPVRGLEGMHDLYATIGTFENVEFEIIFNEAEWMYHP